MRAVTSNIDAGNFFHKHKDRMNSWIRNGRICCDFSSSRHPRLSCRTPIYTIKAIRNSLENKHRSLCDICDDKPVFWIDNDAVAVREKTLADALQQLPFVSPYVDLVLAADHNVVIAQYGDTRRVQAFSFNLKRKGWNSILFPMSIWTEHDCWKNNLGSKH